MTPHQLIELASKATPGPLTLEPWDGYELKFQLMAAPIRRTTNSGQTETAALVVARFSKEEDAALICALRNCAEELLTLWEAAQEYADCEFGMQPQGGGKERWEHRKSKLEAFKAALSRLREKGEV